MLSEKIANKLRGSINDEFNFFSKMETEKVQNVWNQICAMMDRIENTIRHINLLNIKLSDNTRTAYGFCDVLNNVYNLICYIEVIHGYFPSDEYSKIKKSCKIFNQPGKDGLGSDLYYIKYLRSLSAPHSLNTSYYLNKYQDSKEYCPFVFWEDRKNDDGIHTDIKFHIYQDNNNSNKNIYVDSRKIYDFATKMINSLEFVFDKIHDKVQIYYKDLSKMQLKSIEDFELKSEFIKYINFEYSNRLTNDYVEVFDYYARLFDYDFSKFKSHSLIEKYKEEIIKSIDYFRTYLQTFDLKMNSFYFTELYSPYPSGKKLENYGYHLQKIIYINHNNSSNSRFVKDLVNDMKPFFDEYLDIDEAQTSFELFTLVSTALFLYKKELDNDI